MSLDRSLKSRGTLAAKRSVLKRAERVAKLTTDRRFEPGTSRVLGLPKTLPPKA
jgi:small basic protein (TIGR04137 family)